MFKYILLLAFSTHVLCQTYFIKEGSDSSGGYFPSLYNALQTIGSNNAIISVYPGIYTEYRTSVIQSNIRLESFNKSAPRPIFQCSQNLTSGMIYVSGATFSVSGLTFRDCHNATQQGGIMNINLVTTATVDSCDFYNSDSAEGHGGAVRIAFSKNLVINNCKFYNNTAVNGGALILSNVNATVSNTIFVGNNAAFGGGMQLYDFCNVTITNITMIQNMAYTFGGAVDGGYLQTATIFFKDSVFIGNSAGDQGGAFRIVSAEFHFNNCTFSNNNAIRGGAILHGYYYSTGQRDLITIDASKFYNNTATYGGALYLANAFWNGSARLYSTVQNSVFANNQADNNGGAISVYGAYVVKFDTLTILNNSAPAGGGIYTGDFIVSLDILHSVITNNEGGFYCTSQDVTITNSSIYNNVNNKDFECTSVCNITGLDNACQGPCSYRDICSVCEGNSTCLGCDGKPFSNAQYDVCGICGGNGTCLELTTGTIVSTSETTNGMNPSSVRDSSSPNMSMIVIIAAVVGTVLLAVIGIVIFLVIKRRNKPKNRESFVLETKEIEIKDIEIGKRLGGGHFSDVYEGTWQGTTKVALKSLKLEGEMKEFIQESQLLHSLNHPNILRFLGIYKKQYIVTELMSESLLSFIISNNTKLTSNDYINMAIQVSAGMKYLELRSIVHRDLACRNLLISGHEKPSIKIADLGLARTAEKEIYKSKGSAIPIKWSAPEVYKHGISTSRSDSWSFGVVLWEIFSGGQIPYVSLSNEEVVEKVNGGYRMPPPANVPMKIEELMANCWKEKPENRPSFSDIYALLSTMTTEEIAVRKSKPVINLENVPHYQ